MLRDLPADAHPPDLAGGVAYNQGVRADVGDNDGTSSEIAHRPIVMPQPMVALALIVAPSSTWVNTSSQVSASIPTIVSRSSGHRSSIC